MNLLCEKHRAPVVDQWCQFWYSIVHASWALQCQAASTGPTRGCWGLGPPSNCLVKDLLEISLHKGADTGLADELRMSGELPHLLDSHPCAQDCGRETQKHSCDVDVISWRTWTTCPTSVWIQALPDSTISDTDPNYCPFTARVVNFIYNKAAEAD